eukprot:SAG22_NODE_8956_length_618_cov_1.872832_1_plen_118_part_10
MGAWAIIYVRKRGKRFINYGGDIGYVVDQIGRPIDIGRGIIPDPRGPMFDDTVPERIIGPGNQQFQMTRGDLPPAEIKRIMDATRPYNHTRINAKFRSTTTKFKFRPVSISFHYYCPI